MERTAPGLLVLLATVGCGSGADDRDGPERGAEPGAAAAVRPRDAEAAEEPAAAPAPLLRRDPGPAGVEEAWIPGGTFWMGSVDPLARPDEAPVHRVRVEGFWMETTEVTNRAFMRFVDETGYVTVAERPLVWEEIAAQLPPGTPRLPDEELAPGSLVFTPPDHAVPLQRHDLWWTWTPGAYWRAPEGPGSDLDGRLDHPVVHVAHEDARAYAAWAGKRLPTEAEWERAARGGLHRAPFVWGDGELAPGRCNVWQGPFPHGGTAEDGFARTAPVGSFPPNPFGLHDMAGNVWEWCADFYDPATYALRVEAAGGAVVVDPRGPERSVDPRTPYSEVSRVQRGGSFLCNDTYCASYRPSARMASAEDTGLAHLGFRCVSDGPPPADRPAGAADR